MPFDLSNETTQRLLLGLFFFPALWFLCRKPVGDLLVGMVLAVICALLFYTNSPNASLCVYIVGCALIRGGKLERGVALACMGVFLVFIIEGLCGYSIDAPFMLGTPEPAVSPHNAAMLKLAVLIGLPHLIQGLWPIDEDELEPDQKDDRSPRQILDDQCEAIRKCVAEGKGKDAVPLIVQLLQMTQDDGVRLTCVEALKGIGEPTEPVFSALELAKTSDSVKVKTAADEAISALKKTPSTPATVPPAE